MFDYAKNHASPPVSLTADQISTELEAEAKVGDLELNRHQGVDDWVITKQSAVLGDLVPSGKTDFTETMKKLL